MTKPETKTVLGRVFTWDVGRAKWSRQWVHETPEDALRDLANEASSWAPVLAELARLGIGGGK